MRFSICDLRFSVAILCLLAGQVFGAISASTVWEVRATGAQTNGGGFVTGASGTDYSQQAAAQYTLTTVTSAGATTVMTHASAAADMVGNICRVVSGTNATLGWYQIISVNIGVDITVDRNWCTGAVANGVVNVGGAFLIGGTLDDDFTEAVIAGNTIYVGSGTYTTGENISQSSAGTAVAPITWIGYTAARNDTTVGTDRPLIAAGTRAVTFYLYAIFRNFRFTTTHINGINFWGDIVINSKAQNTSASANLYAFQGNFNSHFIRCEGISDNGSAFYMASRIRLIACYAHDSATAVTANSIGTVLNCVIDTCTTGIVCGNNSEIVILNNTIYNCTTGISGTTAYLNIFANNIISGCTTGASWTTATPFNLWDHNCWNNTTDVSNVTKGPNDITANPLLTDPANGDFTLQAGSPCLDAGLQIGSNEGVIGDYKINIGLDQDDNTAAAGGGATVYMGNF